ncbi:uncharacterized protein CDAR_467531 [Caerostris darwini]|uniref:Uncharacterized protein n=1 Tax=Caerostris darwini TaxID=1538125 RepID=A0AAV4RNX2_9ARAC|nr:uncharacterized protein CDAR_467531 [Caerostris darwini]
MQILLYGSGDRHNPSLTSVSSKGGSNQYHAYNSLPRSGPHQGNAGPNAKGEVEIINNPAVHQQVAALHRDGSLRSGHGSRGRMYLQLHRGPSSSSTSDNNSDATYTDSEPITRRMRGNPSLEGQTSKIF